MEAYRVVGHGGVQWIESNRRNTIIGAKKHTHKRIDNFVLVNEYEKQTPRSTHSVQWFNFSSIKSYKVPFSRDNMKHEMILNKMYFTTAFNKIMAIDHKQMTLFTKFADWSKCKYK